MASTKGRVADAAHDCIASFDAIAQINTPEPESSETATGWSQNEDGLSRFQIWMSNLGAVHLATDRRSADYRLREAPEVVDRIVELLEELTEINGEVLEIVSGERSNRQIAEEDSETDSSSPDKGQDELSELFLSIGDVLTSLFKVSMLVKKATTRDRYARAASAKDKPYLVEFDIRHVADKYPKAREHPWLLERLGTAITQRRQFLRYCRNHKTRIAHVSSSDIAVLNDDTPRPLYQDGELGLPAHKTHVASSAKTPMTRPTLSPTAASTLQPDKIVREDLQDLDDNDDAVSQSTSVAYSQATAEGSGHLRIVRLQDLSHNHEPFECPYCYSIVQAKKQRSWRKHVLSDLRAYVCIFEDCDAGLFEDKAAWALHDAEEHRRQWDCQHCRNTDRPFSSSQGLHEHLRTLHAGDGLPAEVLTQVVKASSRPLSETVPDCPLCDFDVDVHHEADRLGQAIPSGSQAVIPLAELQKHLALHQEQLALFAIPPAVERGVESESRHGKSQVGPDEQIKMMADWQDDMSELDAVEEARQFQDSEPDISLAGGSTEESPTPLVQPHSSTKSPVELPGIDTALYKPQEGDSSSISPGDIVYVSRLNGEQLIYDKAVYLGKIGDGQHVARDWNTKNDLKVSLSELVRKGHVTEDETIEAESIVSYVAPPNPEMLSKSRFYLKHATVPYEIKFSFMAEVNALAAGSRRLAGYGTDRAVVRKTCSVFLAYKSPLMDRNVRVEELVRMFYASAVSVVPEAGVESHAALLTDVLIRVIDETSEQIFPERDIVSAQLCEEQTGMISRANRAFQDMKGLSSAASDELAASTLEHRLKEATLGPDFLSVATQSKETPSTSLDHLRNITLPLGIMSTLIMKASKLGSGDEMLVGYDEATVRTTFSSFMRQYGTKVLDRSVCVKDIVHMFYASAKSDLANDATLSAIVRTKLVERHAALLTEVLIGIIDQVTERYFPDRDIVSSQLREEQADMMSRANQASRDAKSDVTSGEHDGSTRDERLKEFELSSQSIEALKSRLVLVIEGEETGLALSKFGAHLMRQTCSSFLPRLQSIHIHGRLRMQLVAILEAFYECARTEVRQDRATSNKESRSVAAERLVVSLLDLLITIDAGLERKGFNTTPTDIPGRITAVLMEERSRYLTQASEIEKRLFRVSERSKPEFDIHFFTEQSRHAHNKRYGEMVTGGEDEPSDPDDSTAPKYCYCLRGSHGIMVACDGPNCRRKWFHLSCTDLKKPLSDYKTWFCIFCQPPVSKATEDTPEATAAAIFDKDDKEPEIIETRESGETAKERPPRGMVCTDCKFVWRSVSASELRDCPNCGSYSVFAGSPPKATSPERTDASIRPGATGEGAMGQYFSERTDKFMSLYRRETLVESKPELPRDDFPDPRSHLHTSPANSPQLEESPSPLPKDPLPDFGNSDNTSDMSALVVNPDLRRVRRTIMYLKYTIEGFHSTQSENSYRRSFTANSGMRVVYDQICSVARTLENLLQDNIQGEGLPGWELKLQSFGSSLSTLCLSMNITLEDLNNALGSSEADKWEEVVRKMEDDEKVGCLKRFEWYRILIAILLTLAEGSTNEHLLSDKLRFEENISSLLRLQDPDGLQAGHKGEAATTIAEEPAVRPPDSAASGNTTEDRSTLATDSDLFAVLQLRQALSQIGHANRILNQAYSESNGDFSGDEDINYLKRRLRSVGDGLRKLLGDRSDDAEYMIELRSLHDISSAFCSSIEITLEDLLIAVKSGDARQWSHTLRMMEEVESVGLLERFRYYEELVDFNIVWMDAGFRTNIWSDPHERVRELLASQESNSLQVAERRLHRQAIWPVEMVPQSDLRSPQLEYEQIGSGSNEAPKLEGPPALPEDPLPDISTSKIRTGDAAAPMVDPDSITAHQFRTMLGQTKDAAHRLIEFHSRSSKNVTSTSESKAAEGQLRMARDVLNRLLRRQSSNIDDAERRAKLRPHGDKFYTSCFTIETALKAVMIAIDPPDIVKIFGTQQLLEDLSNLVIALAHPIEEFKDDNVSSGPEANVSGELDSLQAAGGEFYRQDNPDWQTEENTLSDWHEPQVQEEQIEGFFDESAGFFRHEEEEMNASDASLPELRVSAPSPPPSSSVETNEAPITLFGGPAARRGPYDGSSEDEGEERIIMSEDPAASASHDRVWESQEKPAGMSAGSTNPEPEHLSQLEPYYPRPTPRGPDWTPRKLADLMLQRDDEEPALAPEQPTSSIISKEPASTTQDRGRESGKESAVMPAGSANQRTHHARGDEDGREEEAETAVPKDPGTASHDISRGSRKELLDTRDSSTSFAELAQPRQTMDDRSEMPPPTVREQREGSEAFQSAPTPRTLKSTSSGTVYVSLPALPHRSRATHDPPYQHSDKRDFEDRHRSPTTAKSGLSSLLPFRDFDAAREFSREIARRQEAEAEATRRARENLEAEIRKLDPEAERARLRRQMHKTLDNFVDDGPSSVSRPKATIADRGFEGRLGSRSIRERRRQDIERERTRAAAEGLQEPVEEGVDAGEEQIFDEYDEMLMDDDLYNYAEGTMRRRRRQRSWERRRDSWS